MQIAGRDTSTIVKSVLDRRHYIAARNMVRLYEHPADMFRRYLTGTGTYPTTVRVKTPMSRLDLHLYTPHDVLTVNEIFCRDDYHADAADKVVVDFGSNIGISAAYFLSRGPDTFIYLFEPLPANITKLKENLKRFEGRYKLDEVAVGPEEGEVSFGWEETGRYGGVNAEMANTLTVMCRNSTKVLEDVIAEHGTVDILKVDIETLEEAVVDAIPLDAARKIKKIYVEFTFTHNPLAATHDLRQYGTIAQFTLKGH